MGYFRNYWRHKPTVAEFEAEIERLRAKAPVPTLWLFGKTGSGKSSLVRYLTGAEAATIGEGFRPETKRSARYDFPDSLEPLLTFLDTRGLGEANYDPTQDIHSFAESTQLMIVTVRVADHALEGVLEPLRAIRRATPGRTVLLVLTRLHEVPGAYDIASGPDPFPLVGDLPEVSQPENDLQVRVPEELQTLIDAKSKQFDGLVDAMIPVDLTKPEDGFADPNFGGSRLKQAILEHMPHAYRQALLGLTSGGAGARNHRQQQAKRQVLAASALAASVGAVPLPWVDIPAVLAIQTHLAMKIAAIYQQELTPAHWAVLSSAAGSRIAVQLAIRELLKFIPIVGMAAGAANSFAFTYALGMSWDWYFTAVHGGHVPSTEKLKEIFAQQLRRGHQLWSAP